MTRRIALCLLCLALALPALGQTTQLNGAGATFPYPIYSKWFSEYNKIHSNVQINYQSIGSGGGINQLKAGTVDFGASDMPLKDDKVKEIPVPFVQLPTVLGSVVPSYNIQRGHGRIEVHAAGAGGDLSWQDHQVERPGHRKSQSGREASRQGNRGDPSF